MEFARRFMMSVAFLLLLLLGASANAQSDVRTPDQKVYFPQMDPVLIGMWEGHDDREGMRYDPQAIACMMRACAAIQATIPRTAERCQDSTDPNCLYTEVRDSRSSLYKSCYSAHLARVEQPGYTRLANPPALTSLVCSVIAAQQLSTNERIYTATNGHPRQRTQQRPPTAKTKRSPLRAGEANELLAELNSIAAATPLTPDEFKNTYAVQRKTYPASANETTYGGQLPGFRIISQDDKEAVLLVLPGGDYYAVQRSFLAKDYETDSVAVMAYAGNNRAQIFFPYLLTPGKIELYKPRLRLKGDDVKGRLGPIDADTREFVRRCADGSCEARFALQAGETLRLPRKSTTPSANPSAPVEEKPPTAKGQTAANEPPPAASTPPDMELDEVPLPAASAAASVATIASVPPEEPMPPAAATTVPDTSKGVPAASANEETIEGWDEATPAGSAEPMAVPSTSPDKTTASVDQQSFLNRNFLPIMVLLLTALLGCIIGFARRHHKPPGATEPSEPATPDPGEGTPQPTVSIKTVAPASGVPPDPNPPGTFTPVPVAKVSEPKAKVVILLPGSSGPNEPTIPSNNQAAATAGQSGSTATGGLDPPKAPTGST